MSDELTFTEKSVLFILMAEAREIPNADLTNRYRTKLDLKSRDKLKRQGLIGVRKDGRFLNLELTDLGWKRCLEEFGSPVPPGAGAGGAALYAVLGVLGRYLERTNTQHADLFAPAATNELTVDEIERRVRAAYDQLARRPGALIRMADLRDALPDIQRSHLDRVLRDMSVARVARLVPESNQKTLTQRDRDAAVRSGNQDKHLFAVDS